MFVMSMVTMMIVTSSSRLRAAPGFFIFAAGKNRKAVVDQIPMVVQLFFGGPVQVLADDLAPGGGGWSAGSEEMRRFDIGGCKICHRIIKAFFVCFFFFLRLFVCCMFILLLTLFSLLYFQLYNKEKQSRLL